MSKFAFKAPGNGRIAKWLVGNGKLIKRGQKAAAVISCENAIDLVAQVTGKLTILIDSGTFLEGDILGQVEECLHPIDYLGLCIFCHVDVGNRTEATQTVGGQHVLNVTASGISNLSISNSSRLLDEKKLLLVLDLDHSVLHASADPTSMSLLQRIENPEKKGLFAFDMISSSGLQHHVVKFRPHARDMVISLSKHFDIRVFTWGIRQYAEKVVSLLDPSGKILTEIVTRDDVGWSLDQGIQQKDLLRIFPCDPRLVLIIDDDERVWSDSCENLMDIPRYEYWDPAREYAHGASASGSNAPEAAADLMKQKDDHDNVLEGFESILKTIHAAFFAPNASGSPSDVRTILSFLRNRVLKDLNISFSGIYPQGGFESCKDVKIAQVLGARCHDSVSESTDILIAARKGTEKFNFAKKLGIPVVNRLWLRAAYAHLRVPKLHLFSSLDGISDHMPPTFLPGTFSISEALDAYQNGFHSGSRKRTRASLSDEDDLQAELEAMLESEFQ